MTPPDMGRLRFAARLATLAAACALGACSAGLPAVPRLPAQSQILDRVIDREHEADDHEGVEHVHMRTSALSIVRINRPVGPEMRKRKVEYTFAEPLLNNLVESLSADGVQVSLQVRPETGTTPLSSLQSKPVEPLEGFGDRDRNKPIPALLAQAAAGGPPSTQVSSRSGGSGGRKDDDLSQRRIPFLSYNGTLGGLLDALQTSAGLVSWQEGDMIYINDTDRFAVAVPQDEEVVKSLSQTLQDLGATEVVANVDSGRIIYSAQATTQRESIAPFLKQHLRNLSTITMQVAIVSIALNDKSGSGFDWSQLALGLQQIQNTAANGLLGTNAGLGTTATGLGTNGIGTNGVANSATTVAGNTVGTTNATGTSLLTSSAGSQSATLGTSASALNLAATLGSAKILGVQSAISVAGAIQYLSNFGDTNVTQDLRLRTLSGKEVKFQSGDEIPYVKGVGLGQLGSGYGGGSSGYSGGGYGSGFGTAQTDTVKTGIQFHVMPRYEANNDLVTMNMKMELAQLVEFIQLNAGAQLGTLTQPHTSTQKLDDIIRIRAGQTAIIGGLQADNEAHNGNEPTELRERAAPGASFGSRTQNVQRTALFIIVRPTVVVYDPEGPAASAPERPRGRR